MLQPFFPFIIIIITTTTTTTIITTTTSTTTTTTIIQLVQMLGEGDEELVPEHLVLQDKLQELQYKKQHMDHLVAEFQTLHNHPSLTTGK